jgi:hypothetical protein
MAEETACGKQKTSDVWVKTAASFHLLQPGSQPTILKTHTNNSN